MKIPSSQVPQADVLPDVVNTVIAVSKGLRSFQEIAKYINKVGRQGRYYRRAAEILGFIKNQRNQSILTQKGQELVAATGNQRIHILYNAVLHARLFQRLIPFLEKHSAGFTQQELLSFIETVTTREIGPTMLPRRYSSVVAWLKELDLIKSTRGKYLFTPTAMISFPPTEYDIEEPLVPEGHSMQEYQTVSKRFKKMQSVIYYMIDYTKTERALKTHQILIDMIATRIRQSGLIPRYNQLIDLATYNKDFPIIFEMKSITDENTRKQVRLGLSQLYEYRYLQALDKASLVLVCSRSLSKDNQWLSDYLEQDRNVHFIWRSGKKLGASSETQRQLSFLW